MRLIKNVKANWWDHIINLVVVFLGVTIAFQLGNWKEIREQKQLEKDFCINMIADLESDLDGLKMAKDTIPFLVKGFNQILQTGYSKNFQDSSLMKNVYLLYHQMYFLPHPVTYTSYVNAGKIDIIKDLDLKRSITNYYEIYLGFVERMEKGAEDYRSIQFLPYVMKNVRYAGQDRLADFAFFQDPYFYNLLIGRIRLEEGKLYAYEMALMHAETLKEQLETYLKIEKKNENTGRENTDTAPTRQERGEHLEETL